MIRALPSSQSFKPRGVLRDQYWDSIGMSSSEHERIRDIHQGLHFSVFEKLIEQTAVSQSEFYRVTKLPSTTIKRRLKNKEPFTLFEGDVILRLATLTKLAFDLFGDKKQAQKWLQEEVYGLGGKRPLDMIATTAEFEMVKDLIGRLEHGVFT